MAEQPAPKSVADARQEVIDARRAVESELDDMGLALRAAVDIPTKIKNNPVRTIGVGAGAAFLLLGGPKRALKQVESRFFPRRRYRRLTPDEIDRAVDRLGEEEAQAQKAHLERDFASYLKKEHAKEQPSARRSFWGTYDTVAAIVGAAAARELVKKFIEVPAEARKEVAEDEAEASQAEAKEAQADVKAASAKSAAEAKRQSRRATHR